MSGTLSRRRRIAALFGALAVLPLSGGALMAGPLNPPPGPVAPTHKTLTEVEPRVAINSTNTPGDADSVFRITQPGSYYLTRNVVGQFGKHGIEIASSGVTLDLSGFEVGGVAGALDGIANTVPGATNICIRNGSVRNWSGDGIDLVTSLSLNARITEVLANFNAGFGIRAGNGCNVTHCGANGNGGGGFEVANQVRISHCVALSNSNIGLDAGQGAEVDHCTVSFNLGSTVALRSGGYGVISDCVVVGNPGDGIRTGFSSSVLDCTSEGNNGFGIFTDQASTVSRCTVVFSQVAGIAVGDGSAVLDCTVRFSNDDGVRCGSACTIRGNTLASNSNGSSDGSNILAAGSDNRIEGNNCVQSFRGIEVTGTGNIIVRNTCSGNSTNWAVAAGNVCLVVQGITGAAINGNAGGVAPGSTDPNANFTY